MTTSLKRQYPDLYMSCRWGQQLGRMDISWEAGSNRILAYTGAPINMTEDLPQSERTP